MFTPNILRQSSRSPSANDPLEAEPGVIDKNLQRAEVLDRPGHEGCAGRGIRDVGRCGERHDPPLKASSCSKRMMCPLRRPAAGVQR